MQILERPINFIASQMPGITFTLVTLLGGGFLKEFFDERARKKQHKLQVARHVLGICNEASTANFKHSPRERERVNSICLNLQGIDNNMGIVMKQYIVLWDNMALIYQSHFDGKETKDLIKMHKEVEEKSKILISWANKIRVG